MANATESGCDAAQLFVFLKHDASGHVFALISDASHDDVELACSVCWEWAADPDVPLGVDHADEMTTTLRRQLELAMQQREHDA